MYKHDGFWIGDAWYFVDGAEIHMFYLTQSHRENSKRGHAPHVGHAVSEDLIHWEYVGVALSAQGRCGWEHWRLATGSVVKWRGQYWMAYTGHERSEGPFRQRCGIVVSHDLYRWERIDGNPVTEPDGDLYETSPTGVRKHAVHWRDPFLLVQGDHILMLVCAMRNEGDPLLRGTVAVAHSMDMHHWEIRPPLAHDLLGGEMEVPQVQHIGGRWYFVFCMHPSMFPASSPLADLPPSSYCMVGESATGPFKVHGSGRIAGAAEQGLYADQLVHHESEWFLLGTIDGCITDPYRVIASETGLSIASV